MQSSDLEMASSLLRVSSSGMVLAIVATCYVDVSLAKTALLEVAHLDSSRLGKLYVSGERRVQTHVAACWQDRILTLLDIESSIPRETESLEDTSNDLAVVDRKHSKVVTSSIGHAGG